MMIDYRWSKLSPDFFGLHSSILMFFPAWFASFSMGNGLPWVIFLSAVAYAAYLIVGSMRSLGPLEYASYLWCKFVLGFVWHVREW